MLCENWICITQGTYELLIMETLYSSIFMMCHFLPSKNIICRKMLVDIIMCTCVRCIKDSKLLSLYFTEWFFKLQFLLTLIPHLLSSAYNIVVAIQTHQLKINCQWLCPCAINWILATFGIIWLYPKMQRKLKVYPDIFQYIFFH